MLLVASEGQLVWSNEMRGRSSVSSRISANISGVSTEGRDFRGKKGGFCSGLHGHVCVHYTTIVYYSLASFP